MSIRHKKPWVVRPYVPKSCTPTRSRSEAFVARSGSIGLYTIATIYGGSRTESIQPFDDYSLAYTDQTFTTSCESQYVQTQDAVWDGEVIDFSYPRFKNCVNQRTDLSFLPGKEFVHHTWNTYYGMQVNDIFITFHGNPTMSDRMPTSLQRCTQLGYCRNPSTFVSEASSEALSAIKQKLLTDNALLNFREVFNVLNFIAELKDLRNLPSLIKKWTKTTHDVSDKFLGISFGVLPFYSDIMAIIHRLNNLGPAIDEWNAAAQECNTRAYHITVPLSAGYGNEVAPGVYSNVIDYVSDISYGAIPVPCCVRVIATQSIKCKAHIYLIPRSIPAHLIDELKRRIWGVDKPIAAAWEAVPFSFVVDWFLKIGSIIEEFEKEAPLLQYRILNAGYSVKVDTTVMHTEGRSLEDYDFGGLTLHHTHYERVSLPTEDLLSPSKNYELGFHTIDGNKALLGTALLHQLLR